MPRRWSPRDWRGLLGVIMLGGGGIAVTVLAWRSLDALAAKSTSPWPVAYFAYGCLVLIGVVLTGFSAILGRRTFKFRVGDNEIATTGEEADRLLDRTEP